MDESLGSSIAQHTTRRRVLAGGASLLSAGAGVAVLGGSEGTARAAEVSSDGLNVNGAHYDAPDGQLYSPRIDVDATWSFEGCDAATGIMVALLMDGGMTDSTTLAIPGPSGSGTTAVGAPVADSRNWDAEEWTPPDGGTVEHTVAVRVAFEVRDDANDTLATAEATDDVPISVDDAGPTRVASVGGSGSVTFVPEQGDEPVSGNATQ